jgi:hypothetical protein
MEYLLLIHDDEATWGAMSDDERGRLYQEYGAFSQELRDKGA